MLLKNYAEFLISITQEEIDIFCEMNKDRNPQHTRSAERVVIPGMLTLSKSLGETDINYWTVWLVEEHLRFKKSVYLDESIIVRHTLIKEKTTPQGVFQHIKIDVKVEEEIRFTGWMKILKVPK
jgi:acyl dehydratase